MYSYLLSLHVLTVAVWLGAMVCLGIMLLVVRKSLHVLEVQSIVKSAVKLVNRVLNPAALIVLATGIWMIIDSGLMGSHDKPLWLKMMEDGGGMIVLVSIVALTVLGNRVKKYAQQPTLVSTAEKPYRLLTRTSQWMFSLSVLVTAVIVVVMLKV